MTTQTSYNLSSVHPSLARVARAVSPQEVAVIDWLEHKVLHRFRAQPGNVAAVSLHPDGERVAVLSDHPCVTIWKLSEQVLKIETSGQNVWLAEDRVLVSDGPELRAFSLADGQLVWSVKHTDGFASRPGLLSVGSLIAWSAMGARDLVLVDFSGQVKRTISGNVELFALGFHPDGKRLAMTTRGQDAAHGVQVWGVNAELPERTFSIVFNSLAVGFSPGGGTVVTGDAMGAQLWDSASGAPERRLAERHTQKVKGFGNIEGPRQSLVTAVGFDSSGNFAVSDGEYLRVWDAKSGDPLWTFTP